MITSDGKLSDCQLSALLVVRSCDVCCWTVFKCYKYKNTTFWNVTAVCQFSLFVCAALIDFRKRRSFVWFQPVFARPRNSYFAPCRQSARLHTKTRPLAWPHQSRELRHVPQPCRLYHWCRHVTRFLLPISASEHLSAMRKQFATYFKEDYRSFAWVRDPFVCTANELSNDMQEQLIELKSDSRLKELFSSSPLSSFWAALMQELCEDSPSFRVDIFVWGRILKNDCTQNEIPQSCTNRGWFEAMFIKHWELRIFARQSRLRSHINITYQQASVKNADDAYY